MKREELIIFTHKKRFLLKGVLSAILLVFASFYGMAQPSNDDCANAVDLCLGQVVSGTTTAATLEQCSGSDPDGCADDNFPCFVPSATVWYKFTTTANGTVTVNFSNIVIAPGANLGNTLNAVIVQSSNPCEGGNYTEVSNCQNNGMIGFSLNSIGALTANTTYYIQVNGAMVGPGVTSPAQADFDIEVTGPGVAVQPLSIDPISAANTTICQGDGETINVGLNNCVGTPEFEWYFNSGLVYTAPDFSTSILNASGDLYLEVTCGPEACPQTVTSNTIQFDVTPIEVDAGPDLLLELGQTVTLEGSGIGTPVWTPSTDLSATNTFTPIANPEETTTYFLTVTNGNCQLTDEMVVELKRDIIIPTGFSPNGDNRNDIWEITNINQYLNSQIVIYDRAGQVVFRTIGYNNLTNNWDGTYNGRPVPPSTYFYFIDLRTDDDDDVYRGPLTIIR